MTPADRLASVLTQSRRGTLVTYDESRGGTVAVLEQSFGRNRFRRLYIQGVSNSGDAMPSLRYMRLQALLPLIVHSGEPQSAMVIGFGTGITAGALSRYPGLDRRVVAELLPAVVRAGSAFKGNFDAASNPLLDIRLRDGRRELLRSGEQYDLVTLEPPPPSAAGVANLYSSDFYRLASSRLRSGGTVAQWLPIATQNDADTRSLVRSFIDVFPHVSLWTTEFHEMLMVGSLQPIDMRAADIVRRFAKPGVSDALREVGVASAAALLATYVTDRDGLARYAAAAPPVTDDRPLIEYATWVGRRELARTLPNLLALQTDPPLRDADDALRRAIATERNSLMTFYRAGLHAYNGEHERWAREITLLEKQDNQNPYYRWFTNWGNR
jgi:spermidine synthase